MGLAHRPRWPPLVQAFRLSCLVSSSEFTVSNQSPQLTTKWGRSPDRGNCQVRHSACMRMRGKTNSTNWWSDRVRKLRLHAPLGRAAFVLVLRPRKSCSIWSSENQLKIDYEDEDEDEHDNCFTHSLQRGRRKGSTAWAFAQLSEVSGGRGAPCHLAMEAGSILALISGQHWERS